MIYESVNIPLWRALKPLRGQRVLDVGCGTGALGELLEKNGNHVTGITFSPAEAQIASARLSEVQVQDLNSQAGIEAAVRGTYPVMIFADVLEHLHDPSGTLALLLRKLEPGGRVYVSLPNIACFYVRLRLLFGQFTMSQTGGILDDTHLHFYTLRTARELIRGAGLQIEKVDFVPAPSVWLYQILAPRGRRDAFPAFAGGRPPRMAERGLFRFYARYLYPLEHAAVRLWRTLLANQFVFTCRRRA